MRKNLQHIRIEKWEEDNTSLASKNFQLKSTYSEKDLENLEQLDFGAGFAPNLRGIHTTMYVQTPWKIHKKNESTIDYVEDMKLKINSFSVDEISVLRTTTATILPIVAFYIIAAEEHNLQPEMLSGIIEIEILEELTCPKSYRNLLRISTDILEYTSKKAPKFNPNCISGYSIQEAGASADIELAYTLAHGLEIVKTGLARGMKIDEIAPRLSVAFGIGMNHFIEISKLRAARMIWAKLIQKFAPINNKSLALQIHSQTIKHNLSPHDSCDNLTRTCIEASAAVFGGTQSLQTGILDENNHFANDSAVRIARNTQLYLQKETKITKTVDPWAGSFYVESLTNEIAQKTWKNLEEIENLGGMTKAIEAGFLKLDFNERTIQTRNIDNTKLEKIKATRDAKKVQFSLEKLITAVQKEDGNLLELSIEAAKNRATLEEINIALKTLFNR